MTCSIDGCPEIRTSKTHQRLCQTHYKVMYTLRSARQRCENPRDVHYVDYGGRGIRFRMPHGRDGVIALCETVGPPNPKDTLDRIDVNGHYEIGNLRWATTTEQNRNQRIRPSALEWSKICGEFPAVAQYFAELRA